MAMPRIWTCPKDIPANAESGHPDLSIQAVRASLARKCGTMRGEAQGSAIESGAGADLSGAGLKITKFHQSAPPFGCDAIAGWPHEQVFETLRQQREGANLPVRRGRAEWSVGPLSVMMVVNFVPAAHGAAIFQCEVEGDAAARGVSAMPGVGTIDEFCRRREK